MSVCVCVWGGGGGAAKVFKQTQIQKETHTKDYMKKQSRVSIPKSEKKIGDREGKKKVFVSKVHYPSALIIVTAIVTATYF